MPCVPSIKLVGIRESLISGKCQRRSDTPVSLLPRYAESTRVAVRFRDAVQHSVKSLRQHPHAGPQYPLKNPRLQNLRTWPVAGFEAIRIYYLLEDDTIHVVRILHGKRDVRVILEREEGV